MNLNEALLHAINECIEHDALSLFAYKHFFKRCSDTLIKIIKKDSLYREHQRMVQKCEKLIGSEIALINITTEFNIPSILCIALNGYLNYPLMGMGVSLYSAHALERAVSELMQLYWGRSESIKYNLKSFEATLANRYKSIENYPNYLRCAKFDVNGLLEIKRYKQFSYKDIFSSLKKLNLDKQITHVRKIIELRNFKIGYRPLYLGVKRLLTVRRELILYRRNKPALNCRGNLNWSSGKSGDVLCRP